MKKVFALTIAALILVLSAVPVFAKPSPTKPTDYNVIIHNPNGGTGTYTIEVDEDGQHATLVAHPKNGYEFVGWKIEGDYVLLDGELTDTEITLLMHSDINAYPMFRKIGTSSTTSGHISINSDTTSPKTGDSGSPTFFVFIIAGLFVIAAGAVGVKMVAGKKKD